MKSGELSREEFEKWASKRDMITTRYTQKEFNLEYMDGMTDFAWKVAQHFYAAASGGALRWIPVEEKLPELNEGSEESSIVLVWDSVGYGRLAYYANYVNDLGCWYERGTAHLIFPTHWQPLPAAPDSRPSHVHDPKSPFCATHPDLAKSKPNTRLCDPDEPQIKLRKIADSRPSTEEK